ncbi:MAG: efflux RND transporter periplasmic adaptor subunit [Myxococcales bacterium]|jgi:RND family efflux transporter MFP subunit|nr:efflux RND transporter periplasmic adaptor subunit [Myxococcales bacterium]
MTQPGPALTTPPPEDDTRGASPSATRAKEGAPTGTAQGFRHGKLVVGLLSVAVLGWIGLRVSEAVEEKAEVAVARDAVAARAKQIATEPRRVAVVRGTAETALPTVVFEGTLQAVEQAELGFKVSGRLARLEVAVGDRIKRGAVLARLDAGEAAAQVKSAEAALRAAEAQLFLAKDSETRTQRVVREGVQPESFGVQATQQRSLAEAQRDGAAAQLVLARQNLANHAIVAPFDGTVTRAPEGTGAVVSPGVPLFHIADLSRLKLVGSVSSNDADLVRVGAEVEILAGGRTAAQGKVTAVVAALDESTKRVPVQAVIENTDGSGLIAGTLVRARVTGTEPVPVVRLPHTVLKPGTQDEIFVVEDDKLVGRRISFEIAEDGALLVRRGVKVEEAVVAEPWPEAKSGDVVRSAP